MAVLTVTYGCKNLSLNWIDRRRTGMKFFRPIAGFSILDIKRNTEVRDGFRNIYSDKKNARNEKKLQEHLMRMQ